ncbi:hypothetical protein BJX76DRAFT_343757 [Aspergillus varians]
MSVNESHPGRGLGSAIRNLFRSSSPSPPRRRVSLLLRRSRPAFSTKYFFPVHSLLTLISQAVPSCVDFVSESNAAPHFPRFPSTHPTHASRFSHIKHGRGELEITEEPRVDAEDQC